MYNRSCTSLAMCSIYSLPPRDWEFENISMLYYIQHVYTIGTLYVYTVTKTEYTDILTTSLLLQYHA